MELRPYQEAGRDFLASRRFALLADEMRVGKTPQAILAAQAIGARNIMVVCPAIAVAHWQNEIRKWEATYPSGWCCISYDYLRRNTHDFTSRHWDLVIVDECHFAKNPEAQRTKLIYGKGGLGYCTDRMWALSGTPAPKHAGELWPMLRAFGATGMTYDQFVRYFCEWNDWTQRIAGTKVSAIPELRGLLSKIMLRRRRADVAPEMPAIDFQLLEVEPVSRADLRNTPTGLSDAHLLQWLEEHPTADREDRLAVAMTKALPLVENIAFAIENDLIQQTVVFGWHVEPLEAVVAGLRLRGISADMINGSTSPRRRVEIQTSFRQGRLDVVVANILAAGTAIDLSAASHGYFLELDWVPGNNMQAANRLVSMEKSEPVTFDVCTWPGSADDRVQRVLMRRATELSQLY